MAFAPSAGTPPPHLTFFCLNIQNLHAKFRDYGDLLDDMCMWDAHRRVRYDFLIFLETHHDDADPPVSLPGYTCWATPRVRMYNPERKTMGRTGGVAVYTSTRVTHLLTRKQAPLGNVVALRADPQLFGLDRPVFLLACYVPPYLHPSEEGGEWWDAFALFCEGLADEGYVFLSGDFNARTATAADTLPEADYDDLGIDPDTLHSLLRDPPPRVTQCSHSVDAKGVWLLTVCKTARLLLFNGRQIGSSPASSTACPTCTQGARHSVIDYMAASPELFLRATSFSIHSHPLRTPHLYLSLAILPATLPPSIASLHSRIQAAENRQGRVRYVWSAQAIDIIRQSLSGDARHVQLREALRHACSSGDSSCAGQRAQALLDSLTRIMHQHARLIDCRARAASALLSQMAGSASAFTIAKCGRPPEVNKAISQAARALRYHHYACTHGSQHDVTRTRAEWHRARAHRKRVLKSYRTHRLSAMVRHIAFVRRHAPRDIWRLFLPPLPVSSSLPVSVPTVDAFALAFQSLFQGLKALFFNMLTPQLADRVNDLARQAPLHVDWRANQPFSVVDLQSALSKCSNSSAPGMDGITYSIIRKVGGPILEDLSMIFSTYLRTSYWGYTNDCIIIHPIHKKGTLSDPDNYRGIHLLSVFMKLYGNVLQPLLLQQAKVCPEQAGFRTDHSTIGHCFVLATLIERAKRAGSPFYVCFVDFRKAFDSINRRLLWCKLRAKGVSENIVRALEALYANVEACVDGGYEGFSAVFRELFGVKQGDVLGPLLFSLFVDDLPEYIRQGHANQQSSPLLLLLDLIVFCLLYADDLALVHSTAAGLQRSLDRLYAWCTLNHMDISTHKTKIVVFHPDRVPPYERQRQFYFGGPSQVIERVPVMRYLGMWFHEKGGWKHHIEMMTAKGVAALALHRRRLRQLPPLDLQTRFQLYDATVAPVYLYGSELWAGNKCDALERLHRNYLLSCMRVTRRVSTDALLTELCRFSVLFEARWRQLSFYIRVRNRRAGVLAEKAFFVAQNAYRCATGFSRMQRDSAYMHFHRDNGFSLFAQLLDFMGERPRVSQLGPLTEPEVKTLRCALTKSEFARILEKRWAHARVPSLPATPSLPPPISLTAQAVSLLPWRSYASGQTRVSGRALFQARKLLFVPGCRLFNHSFPVSFPRLHRSFAPPLRECRCDLDSLVCMASYVPAQSYMEVLQHGQDWLHRLIQPLPAFLPYLALPAHQRRVLFLFRTGCHPSALMDGRLIDCPREYRSCAYCSHRNDLLVSVRDVGGHSVPRPPVEDETHILVSCPLYSTLRHALFSTIHKYGITAPDACNYKRWSKAHPIVFTTSLLQSDKLPLLSAVADFLLAAHKERARWLALNPSLPPSQFDGEYDFIYELHEMEQWVLDADLSD